MKKNKNRNSAIIWLIGAAVFAIVGVLAYANDYYIILFRLIPLNGPAFGVIAVLLLAWAIYSLVQAPKKDQEAVVAFEQQVQTAQQAAAQAQPLSSACTVTVGGKLMALGAANKYQVMLNGYPAGEMTARKPLSFATNIDQNTVTVTQTATSTMASCQFMAVAGGAVNIELRISVGGAFTLEVAPPQ